MARGLVVSVQVTRAPYVSIGVPPTDSDDDKDNSRVHWVIRRIFNNCGVDDAISVVSISEMRRGGHVPAYFLSLPSNRS